VHLKMPWNIFPFLISTSSNGSGIVLPKEYIEENGVDYFNAHPIGSGPYKFLEKSEGDYIKYEVVDDHWRVHPEYKYLTFKIVPEEGTRVAALKSGELDIITIGLHNVEDIEADGYPIVEKPGGTDLQVWFLDIWLPDHADNPMSYIEVRQAMTYAVDTEAILEYVYYGYGNRIGHYAAMNTNGLGFRPVDPAPYDLTAAQDLLAGTNWSDGFSLYYVVCEEMFYGGLSLAEVLTSYWEDLGITTEIQIVDRSTFSGITSHKVEKQGWTVLVYPWAGRYAPWRPLFSSNHTMYSYSQISDEVVDDLIAEFDSAVDLDEYVLYHCQLEERMREMFYSIPIVCYPNLFATGKDIPSWNPGLASLESYRWEYVGVE